MELQLYRIYTPREAADLLAEGAAVQWLWGEQLALAQHAAALFAAVGSPEAASHFRTPAAFRFRPGAPFRVEPAEFGWMPAALAGSGRGPRIELFVRDDGGYCYVGPATLAMYTGAGDFRHQYADLELTSRLPRERWIRYGGYPGWKMTVAHEDHLLEPGDEAGVAALLERTNGDADLHLSLTRYDRDRLTLLANGELAYISYQNEWGGEELSRNPAYDPDTEEIAPFFCNCGTALDMPLCYVVSREASLEAVREFFRTGVRPETIDWFEDE